jgi:group I intron endonuclease
MVVYLITNLINGKVYVGQTIRSISWRFSQHKSSARRGDNLALCRAIRKYGEDNFQIEELSHHESDEELSLAEIASIYVYKSADKLHGYNCTYGGEGTRATPETAAKISRAQMGNTYALGLRRGPQSEEHRRKNGLSHMGLKRSAESLRKFRIAMVGHETSQETRDKISKANMGKIVSAETRQRLRNSHLGHIPWNKGKSGYKIK